MDSKQLELQVDTLQESEAYLLYEDMHCTWIDVVLNPLFDIDEYDCGGFGRIQKFIRDRTSESLKSLVGVIVDSTTFNIIKSNMEKTKIKREKEILEQNASKESLTVTITYEFVKIDRIILT